MRAESNLSPIPTFLSILANCAPVTWKCFFFFWLAAANRIYVCVTNWGSILNMIAILLFMGHYRTKNNWAGVKNNWRERHREREILTHCEVFPVRASFNIQGRFPCEMAVTVYGYQLCLQLTASLGHCCFLGYCFGVYTKHLGVW